MYLITNVLQVFQFRQIMIDAGTTATLRLSPLTLFTDRLALWALLFPATLCPIRRDRRKRYNSLSRYAFSSTKHEKRDSHR